MLSEFRERDSIVLSHTSKRWRAPLWQLSGARISGGFSQTLVSCQICQRGVLMKEEEGQ